MARWSFKVASWSAVAVADTTAMVNNQFMALLGGSATQRLNLIEVRWGGQATASAPCYMLLSRDSTVHAGPTALGAGESNAAHDPATAALAAPQVALTAATTKPQRSATLGLLNLSANAFGSGGLWQSPDKEGIWILGNTASNGEVSLSAYTGSTTAPVGSHFIYETI